MVPLILFTFTYLSDERARKGPLAKSFQLYLYVFNITERDDTGFDFRENCIVAKLKNTSEVWDRVYGQIAGIL